MVMLAMQYVGIICDFYLHVNPIFVAPAWWFDYSTIIDYVVVDYFDS